MSTPVRKLAVVGAGTMGRGIAETAATHEIDTLVVEVSPAQRDAAAAHIRASVAKGIQRGKIKAASPDQVLSRIRFEANLAAAAKTDFVIEAVPEDEAVKTAVLRDLDKFCPPQVILASNTSSISITRLAAATGRADKMIGMHFFNPVPIMAPVEVVRGLKTAQETIDTTQVLVGQMGKQGFVVEDSPGFVVNRVLMPLINEAIFALHEGVADAATIDSLTRLGCNHPMGPLALADLVGLDVCLAILKVLYAELGDPKFRPCPLLARMVAAGQLGKKSGHGFYKY